MATEAVEKGNPYLRVVKGVKQPTRLGLQYLSQIVTDPVGPVYFFTAAANLIMVAAAMARLSRRDGDLRITILEEFAGLDDVEVVTKLNRRELNVALRELRIALTAHQRKLIADSSYDWSDEIAAQERALSLLRRTIRDVTKGRMRSVEAAALIHRVVTEFGDDSVQQLITVMFVCESVSNLMTKELEWGRVAASYLEQSTRYIYFDQKDGEGNYRYYVPRGVPAKLRHYYCTVQDEVFDLYSGVVHEVTEHVKVQNPRVNRSVDKNAWRAWPGAVRAQACDAARTILPVGTRSTVGITMSAQALDALIMRLLSRELPEAQEMGRMLLTEARKVIPEFLERTDLPDRGMLTVQYWAETRADVREFAKANLKVKPPAKGEPAVTLLGYSPADETEMVAGMLYAQSGLSMTEIRQQVKGWSRKRKHELMQHYFGKRLNRRHRPGRATEEATFDWELVGDYGTFRDLQRHRLVSAFEWPVLTPHLGYEVPQLVIDAGQEANYRRAFELSAQLYGRLEQEGYHYEAQYALCMGYLMRYRFVTSLRELFHMLELRTSPQGHPGYRKLCNEMYRLLKEAYPVSAAAMQFVNQADNLGELTRMASERASAAKLARINKASKRSKK